MRMRYPLTIAAMAIAMSIGGVGLSAAGSSDKATNQATRGLDCVFFGTVDNWRVLDDNRLVIWTTGDREAYLVTLSMPSPDLRFAINLAFQDANGDGQLCPFGGDAVITDGPVHERLQINTISKLSEKQLKHILADAPSNRRGHRNRSGSGES